MEHSDNSDITARQEALNLTIPKGVAVVGCGGVGSWVAYFLALSGVKEIWLFDHDVVSTSNLNRILATKEDVEQKKSKVVAKYINTFRPSCNVLPMGSFSEQIANSTNMANYVDWVVAATDTMASRKMVYDWAKNPGVHFIEAAADGEYGSATAIPGEWATELENDPGYASVPVWVGPCVLAAVIAVSHIIHDEQMADSTIRIGWDPIKGFDMYDSLQNETEEEDVSESELASEDSPS